MKQFNFISKHLIKQIELLISYKQRVLNHTAFLYFDEPILVGKKSINRVNRFNYYFQDEILPQSFYSLSGIHLLKIYQALKKDNFYIWKEIKGRDYKTRIKKNEQTSTI